MDNELLYMKQTPGCLVSKRTSTEATNKGGLRTFQEAYGDADCAIHYICHKNGANDANPRKHTSFNFYQCISYDKIMTIFFKIRPYRKAEKDVANKIVPSIFSIYYLYKEISLLWRFYFFMEGREEFRLFRDDSRYIHF